MYLPLILLSLLALTSSSPTPSPDQQPTSDASKVSTPFTDAPTGIQMERFFGARTTFGFGIAMPTTPNTSFIGQMSFPLVNGAGWGALGLTGDMENNFFLAAWANGAGGVMASFRQGTNEDNPPEVKGNFAVKTIDKGTSVNSTFLTYTFLCEGCLDANLGLGAAATNANAIMGWALSAKAVPNPASPAGKLGFHEQGFGPFTMRLPLAKNAAFDSWLTMVGKQVVGSPAAKQVALGVAGGQGGGGGEGGKGGEDD